MNITALINHRSLLSTLSSGTSLA